MMLCRDDARVILHPLTPHMIDGGAASDAPGSPGSYSSNNPDEDPGGDAYIGFANKNPGRYHDDSDITFRERRLKIADFEEIDKYYTSSSDEDDTGWSRADSNHHHDGDDDDDDADGDYAEGDSGDSDVIAGGVEGGDGGVEGGDGSVEGGDGGGAGAGAGTSPESGDSSHPRLDELHRPICEEEGAVLMEGGAKHCRFNTKADGSSTYPFKNKSHLLLMQFVTKHQMSRVMLAGLLAMLRFEDSESGEGFDIKDLAGVQAEHFVARTRGYMNLYEVYKRDVRGSPASIAAGGDESTSTVLDVPVNLVLDRQLKCLSSMETFLQNPGGKQLSTDEAIASNLVSPHIFCGPERPSGNSRRTNMHGILARSSPHFGYDGIAPARSKERTVHVNDVAMCSLGASDSAPKTCRILEIFWDAEKKKIIACVRPLFSEEIWEDPPVARHLTALGVQYLRLWEPLGKDEDVTQEIDTTQIMDLCEIYPEPEVENRQSAMNGWKEGDRLVDVQPLACVGVAFVTATTENGNQGDRRRKRRSPGSAISKNKPYRVSGPWMLEGTEDEPLFTIRGDGYLHNIRSRPFVSVPITYYIDGFNAHGMGNKRSIGGSYLGWAFNNSALQRRREETHIATVASPGASKEGETILQFKIMRELEKGCIARATVKASDGGWVTLEVRRILV